METKSKKPIAKIRTHITIGNDDIVTHVYEVPREVPAQARRPSIETLRKLVGAYEELYFPENVAGHS